MNSDYLFVGVRLKEERLRLGLSQAQASEAVGVSREMWGRYERGALPGGEITVRLVASGFDIAYIFGGSKTGDSSQEKANSDSHPLKRFSRRTALHAENFDALSESDKLTLERVVDLAAKQEKNRSLKDSA